MTLFPGPDDGVATASADWPDPRGGVWILRYHGSELDDGVNCTTGGFGCVTEGPARYRDASLSARLEWPRKLKKNRTVIR